MNRTSASNVGMPNNVLTRFATLTFLILLILCNNAAFAQHVNEHGNSTATLSGHATHLLGLESVRNNTTGTLFIQDNALCFQKGSEPAVQITIPSILDVFLGDESKQIGGLPMTLGKAAVPFGGGRVISLFAHKKYDTFALEYVASDGGIHGAIFQLNQGQGKLLRDQLLAIGAHVGRNDEHKQSNVEISNESK